MDTKAFRTLVNGMYVIGVDTGDGRVGCIVNTLLQHTSSPKQVSVTVEKTNCTCNAIRKAGHYSASILGESTPMELIGTFGFHTSTELDKFESWSCDIDVQGDPFLNQYAVSAFSVRVTNEISLGSHVMFIGEVEDAWVLSDEPSMTYSYYHKVKGGKTPPKASSYIAELDNGATEVKVTDVATGKVGWLCTVCGYIEWIDVLPEGYECPVCGAPASDFVRIVE